MWLPAGLRRAARRHRSPDGARQRADGPGRVFRFRAGGEAAGAVL